MHLDREALHSFLLGRLTSLENRQVVRHLLSGCEECRRVSREVWAGGEVPPEIDLSAVAAQVWRQGRDFDREEVLATELVAELLELSPERQQLVARNSSRLRSRSVCERLCDEAERSCSADAERAVQLASVAMELASELSPEHYGPRIVHDVQARTLYTLGHAQREACRLFDADDSFQRAEALLAEGSGDPGQTGQLWYLKAILRHAQRRFTEALTCFRRAARDFEASQDAHKVASTFIDRARTQFEMGDLEEAVRSTRTGLAGIDADRGPRMALVAKHNLTLYLQELGQTEEAIELAGELMPLHARLGGSVDRLRLRWLEGKIAHMQGDRERCQVAFEEVRQAFVEGSMPYDAALVSLDLAAVYVDQERFADVLSLAGETLAVFRTLGIDREAIAAIYFLERAAAARRVSLALLAELAAYLKRSRHRPGLTFEPGGALAEPW